MQELALAALQERIRAAVADRRPLRIRGGGTKDFLGMSFEGHVLDTRALGGIVDYAPTELVITARAGTPLADIEAHMHKHGQMLAFEPPHYGAEATIGGTIASAMSGPRRPYAGAARDFVLGLKVVDGSAQQLSFGGRVMKNVAGFDVARMMTGAFGTLGVITEVSLKCLPMPKVEATCVFECTADDAIRRVNEWGGKPLPISATCFVRGHLHVRLSGAEPAVAAARSVMGGEEHSDAASFWDSVREQTLPFFAVVRDRFVPLWRMSVRSTAPHTDLGGDQLIEWGGALRWLAAGEPTTAQRVRAFAQEHGGHATLYRAGDKRMGVFHALPAPMMMLHRRLKSVFDPHGILNRGRMYPDL
ncbi:MAG TPA: glycolate oxidase subunit GlcE [Casimicrobiaceae bacterium]|nr:glycolate oxidase subunit GlcE [Casimicrobiaceae bacterium]